MDATHGIQEDYSIKCPRDSQTTSKASVGTKSNISRIKASPFVISSPIAVRPISNCSGERKDQIAVVTSPATFKTLGVLPAHTHENYAVSLPLTLQ